LQTHAPLTHTCPIAHSAEDPHLQAPPVHESVRELSHAEQAAPSVPHCDTVGVTQVVPEQHPVGHDPLAPVVQVH
jgi:hypothetical protein